jgi:hypothetical protein
MRAEFKVLFAGFLKMAADANLGEVVPNQWELTYVDHIPRGSLWDTPADWHKVLPGMLAARAGFTGSRLEGFSGEWHYEIEPRRGRLHLGVQHVRVASTGGTEVLQLRTTARGPIRKDPGWDLDAGLELGHDVVRNAFLEITSPEAQRAWGRRE